MKKSRYTEEQIAFALRQAEGGMPVADVCRQMGVSEASFYVWKKKYGQLGLTEIRELRDLTRQRAQLVSARTAVSNRIQKVLEDANIKLSSVASDVLGVSGRAMIAALIRWSVANRFLVLLNDDGMPRLRISPYYRTILANKTGTQEELFHTFNALYNTGKQIILSADSPPAEIPALEDRLVSRFNWGLVARIDPPSYETRIAIVQKKAHLRGLPIGEEIAEYIARQVQALFSPNDLKTSGLRR